MDLPENHRNHVLESNSERHFFTQIPSEWHVEKPSKDYGIDLKCEIANKSVYGLNFSIQLKSKETDINTDYVIITKLKRRTINLWLNRLEPIMLCVYITDEDETYWSWINNNTFDLSKSNKHYQLKIDRRQKFSTISWGEIHEYVKKIFAKRNLLYDIPDQEEEKIDNAWKHYFNKDYRKALFFLKEQNNDTNSNLLNAIAISHYQLFQYKDALVHINKALEIDNKYALLQNKASILIQFGLQSNNIEFAKSANEIYLILENRDPKSFLEKNAYNYANNLKFLKEYLLAIDMYKKALYFSPNNKDAWKNLGSTYFELQKHEEEVDCYDKALTLDPNLVQALFSKGNTLFNVFEKKDEGLNLMLTALKKDKLNYFEMDFPYSYYWVAEAYKKLGKINEAKKWNKKGLINNPIDKFFKVQEIELNKKTA